MALRIVDQPEYSPEDLKSQVDLRVLVAPGKPVRGDKPVKIWCLWHEERREPSLVIWPDRMRCFGCDTSMDLLDFVAWREGMDGEGRSFDRVLAVTAEKYVGLVPPPPPARRRPVKPLRAMSADVADYLHRQLGQRREWLYARGLTDETIEREKLGYERKAFAIPVWSENGELLTVRYRRDDDVLGDEAETRSKYWGITGRNDPVLYNVRALRLVEEWGWVVICEGELDALRLYQEGIPAISATNGASALDESMARQIQKVKPGKVVVAYDQDEGGRINGIRVARMFGRRGRVMRWSPSLGKDVTEYLNKVSVEDFVLLALEAEPPVQVESYWRKTLRNGVWR